MGLYVLKGLLKEGCKIIQQWAKLSEGYEDRVFGALILLRPKILLIVYNNTLYGNIRGYIHGSLDFREYGYEYKSSDNIYGYFRALKQKKAQ